MQHYGSTALDASLLLIPLVGFLPPDDPRVLSTIAAIESQLVVNGLVLRYGTETATAVDGLPPGEGVFLPCSFWLADCMAVSGRRTEAEALFERLLALRNDVGLLSEEFDPRTGHMQGNFPRDTRHGCVSDGTRASRWKFAREATTAFPVNDAIETRIAFSKRILILKV